MLSTGWKQLDPGRVPVHLDEGRASSWHLLLQGAVVGSIALDRCSPAGFLSQLRFGSQVHIWWAELLPEEEGPRLSSSM